MTRTYTHREKRDKGAFQFLLTERDLEILKAVNRYRYLKTIQIRRLIFKGNSSKQSAQRRLKYLYHYGFLGRIVPLIPAGHGSGGDTAYFLDVNGANILKAAGEEVFFYKKSGQNEKTFLNHALDLSEFRINLELALKDHEMVDIHRFTCDFEMKSQTESTVGYHRYKLFDEVVHPINRVRYVVYPDGLIILKGKGKFENFQKLYFLEIDRGTEGLDRIRNKVTGFNLYKKEGVFRKFGKFDDFKVLIQTSSEARANNMRKALTDLEGTDLVWITDYAKVDEKTIAHAPIWLSSQMEPKAILKF